MHTILTVALGLGAIVLGLLAVGVSLFFLLAGLETVRATLMMHRIHTSLRSVGLSTRGSYWRAWRTCFWEGRPGWYVQTSAGDIIYWPLAYRPAGDDRIPG